MPPEAQLLVILLVLVLFWFVLMRPARNQQRRVQHMQSELQVGEEVVLSAGIFGTIRSLDDGRVKLEVSPGTEITVARQAVVRRVEPDLDPQLDPDLEAGALEQPEEPAPETDPGAITPHPEDDQKDQERG